MCGRFVSARKRLELLEEFAANRDAVAADRDPDYNVAPTKRIYAVLERPPEDKDRPSGSTGGHATRPGATERELRLVRWGLVPSWAKDTSGGARLINARSETVAVKPAFRAAFARRRCLIPADGYYEWMTEGKVKKPYYIYRADGGILAFAGIYELWRNSLVPDDHEDAWYWSASIITTQATDDIGRIHDRTPMTIAPDNWADWLDPAARDKELMLAVMRPATASGSDGLASHPVSTAVNSVRNNGPSLIEPLGDEKPPGSSLFLSSLHSRGSSMEISVARKRLEEMRTDLDRTVAVLMGEHHLVRGGTAEAGDAGANLTEADRSAASVQVAVAQRAEVLAALARIDDGSYGKCVDCGGPVPEPRLAARPATARCVPCQAKRDRRRR